MKILAAACLMAAPLCAQWGGLGSLPLIGGNAPAPSLPKTPPAPRDAAAWPCPTPTIPTCRSRKPPWTSDRAGRSTPSSNPRPADRHHHGRGGPGVIRHIWMASEANYAGNGRAGILRFYWDGEATPSIEVPLTDFFAVGHEKFAPVNSLAVSPTPARLINCYWPMPFRRHARITFTNDSARICRCSLIRLLILKWKSPTTRVTFTPSGAAPLPAAPTPSTPSSRREGRGPLRRHLPRLDAAFRRLVRRRARSSSSSTATASSPPSTAPARKTTSEPVTASPRSTAPPITAVP